MMTLHGIELAQAMMALHGIDKHELFCRLWGQSWPDKLPNSTHVDQPSRRGVTTAFRRLQLLPHPAAGPQANALLAPS